MEVAFKGKKLMNCEAALREEISAVCVQVAIRKIETPSVSLLLARQANSICVRSTLNHK